MKETGIKRPGLYALGAIFIITQVLLLFLVAKSRTQEARSRCNAITGTQKIMINSNGFEPKDSTIKVCNKVIFVNADSAPHLPAFGEHDHHQYPGGFSESVLGPGDSNNFVPTRPGTLKFHDHLNYDSIGSLTITP